MRKLRMGKCEYDYVEVMACPSGCLNGGGQVKAAAMGLAPQQLLERVEEAYRHQVRYTSGTAATEVSGRQPKRDRR